jgi:adenylyltransferase/sulfurtransferase
MTVHELRDALESDHPPIVIDVREAEELDISRLESAIHVPISEIPTRVPQLERDASYAILCRSGARSSDVTRYLRAQGFPNVENVEGGINAWAEWIDPRLTIY